MAKKKAAKKKAAPKRTAKTARAAKKAPPKKAAKRSAPKRAAAAPKAPKAPSVRHPIVHWEIQSQRPGDLHRFYAETFGWDVNADNPMNYGMVSSGRNSGGIDGGIGGSPASGSRVTVYAQVPSITDILDRIQSLGGQTVMPRTDIGPVIMALYTDPEGNLMGLIEG